MKNQTCPTVGGAAAVAMPELLERAEHRFTMVQIEERARAQRIADYTAEANEKALYRICIAYDCWQEAAAGGSRFCRDHEVELALLNAELEGETE